MAGATTEFTFSSSQYFATKMSVNDVSSWKMFVYQIGYRRLMYHHSTSSRFERWIYSFDSSTVTWDSLVNGNVDFFFVHTFVSYYKSNIFTTISILSRHSMSNAYWALLFTSTWLFGQMKATWKTFFNENIRYLVLSILQYISNFN